VTAVLSIPRMPAAALTPVGAEALRGLTATPKHLAPWLFYDQRGSELFEAITALPEYYVTRTEREIFSRSAEEILEACGGPLAILELGAGTAAKTGLILDAARRRQDSVTYYPIDISPSALDAAQRHLSENLPDIEIQPRVADYTREMDSLPGAGSRRLVLYIGSSIGNFDPKDATELLRKLRRQLAPGDLLLLGLDHVKDRGTLQRAYNDSARVTAEFNRNILTRLNRELGACFRPTLFRHRARWNDRESRIEMHLESLIAQRVEIVALDMTVGFRRGETIHTENSYKFTAESATALMTRSGFEPMRLWTDPRRWFGVYLARAA
jgi:L-histidine N-alpha-methyltransferase